MKSSEQNASWRSLDMNALMGNFRASAGRIFEWWLTETRGHLPPATLKWLTGENRHWVYVEDSADGVQVGLLAGSEQLQKDEPITVDRSALPQTIATYTKKARRRDSLPLCLVVPEEAVFERRIEIPKEALSNLHNLVTDELVRRTPFRIDSVFMDLKIERHPVDRTRRIVRQRILRRDIVEHCCTRFGLASGAIRFAGTRSLQTSEDLILLSGSHSLISSRKHYVKLLSMLILLTALLIGTNLALLWSQQENELSFLDARITKTRADAIAVRKMIDQITTEQEAIRAVVSEKSGVNAVRAWEEVSSLLPDSSWLTEFQVSDTDLSLSGYSENAAALVPLLGRSTMFAKVALSSPIVSTDRSIERFSISATLRRPSESQEGDR